MTHYETLSAMALAQIQAQVTASMVMAESQARIAMLNFHSGISIQKPSKNIENDFESQNFEEWKEE